MEQKLLSSTLHPEASDKKFHLLETMCEEKGQEITGLQAQLLENVCTAVTNCQLFSVQS